MQTPDPRYDLFDSQTGMVTSSSLADTIADHPEQPQGFFAQKDPVISDLDAMRASLENIFQLSATSAGIDAAEYLKDSSYREAVRGGDDDNNRVRAEIEMFQKESGGDGAVLDRPPPDGGFASKEMQEKMKNMMDGGGGNDGGSGSGAGGGGGGGGADDGGSSGKRGGDDGSLKRMTQSEKYATMGTFSNDVLKNFLSPEKYEAMQMAPLSLMSNLQQVREFVNSADFQYSIAYDTKEKQVLFYTSKNVRFLTDEQKESLNDLSNHDYPYDGSWAVGHELGEVKLNQDREYINENVMVEMGENYEVLNNQTQVHDNALFVSPEMVYREIGEQLFVEVQQQRDKDEAKKERKAKRFRRVRNLLSRIRNVFRRAEKNAEEADKTASSEMTAEKKEPRKDSQTKANDGLKSLEELEQDQKMN